MSTQIRRRGAAAVTPVQVDVDDFQRTATATGKTSVVSKQAKRMGRVARKRQQLRLAARERFALMNKSERETSAAVSIQRVCRTYKFKKILPVMVDCIRVARRWTPAMLFRLYTSLELKAEAQRQGTQLWGEGFEFASAMEGMDTGMTNSPPRAVFEHALTEEGFLGLAKDTGLLALPFVAHTALIHLFRQHASHMPRSAAFQARAKGLFAYLCSSSGVHRLGKEDIAKLLDALGLPRITDEEALPFTYADGTWDVNGFTRHLHQQHWITNVADDHSEASEQKSSTKFETSSSSGDTSASLYSDSSDPDSSVESTDDSTSGPEQLIAIKKEGFETAMQDLACVIRPAGGSCECEGCTTGRSQEAELQRNEGTHMEREIARLRTKALTKELHTSWATVRLYFEVLAPNAARLFASKACAAQDVFGAAWFSPGSRDALFENEQMLREIFLTLVGRQGDRDALDDPNSVREGSGNQSEDTAVLKGLRTDCRNNGFNNVWERAVVAEQGRVGYLELLRFCWDYGLHPSILNNGEDNFLLAHLFVGASQSPVRVVPDEEATEEKGIKGFQDREESCAKLTHLVPDRDLDTWLAEQKLDQLFASQDPALTSLLAQLSEGGGKVSPVKTRDFVQEFILCSNRSLSPGELRTIVRGMERSMREAGTGDQITIQTCLRAVAHSCIFSDAVTSRRLSYGEFVSFFGALSQLQPGLSSSWCRAALHGITRQNCMTMGAVLGRFMSKMEGVHPLLSKDAVRRELQRTSKRSDEDIAGRNKELSCPRLLTDETATPAASRASSSSSRRSVAIRKKWRRAATMSMAPRTRPRSKTAMGSVPRGSKSTASSAPTSRKSTKISGSKGVIRGSITTTKTTAVTGRTTVNLGRSSNAAVKDAATSKIRRTLFAVSTSKTNPPSSISSSSGKMPSIVPEAPLRHPRRGSVTQAGRGSSSLSSPSSSACDLDDPHNGGGKSSDLADMSPIGEFSETEAVRRVEVAKELDSALRTAFDRYSALERSGTGFPEAFREGQGLSFGSVSKDHRISSQGQKRDSILAGPTTRKSGTGHSALASIPSRGRLSPRTLPIVSSSASPPSPLSGKVSLRPSSAKPPVPSTVTPTAAAATVPLTVSIDGFLLFICDTNIFPMLCFERIAATAAEETVSEPSDGSIHNSDGRLDADSFVRVCLQLMRDNFLVTALGYHHRVEALTAQQRAKEWEKRHPGTAEHAALLERLRGWMEHYRLPSRMAPFKRDVFAIGCPTETRPRTAEENLGDRGRRERKRPAALVPHPGPCLIDLWTGQTVARNAVEVSPSSSSARVVKVDDKADRAVLNQIADMMIDLAAPATIAITATSTTAGNVDKGGGNQSLEAATDQVTPLAGEGPLRTEESKGDRDLATSKIPVQRDTDDDHDDADGGANASDTDDSGSSDAGDSLEEMGDKALTGPSGQAALTDDRDNAPCLVKKENVSPGQGNKAGEAHWNGQVTAREVAKKAKAHQLQVSDTVVRILGRIRPEQPEPTSGPSTVHKPGALTEEDVEVDADVDDVEAGDGKEVASASDTSSDASTDRIVAVTVPVMTPDDYTTLPGTHPAQQLLKAGKELVRLKRPEQAVVVWGQAAEILRSIDKVDPRQSLVVLLQLSWTLQKLGRFQDIPPLLLQATETARTIAGWQEQTRLFRNRRLEVTVMGMLGFALIKVESFERALEAFRDMSKRLLGEGIEDAGFKVGRGDPSRAKNKQAARQKEAQFMTREDIELSWQARRGLSTALVGLRRGKEALAEALEAMDLAEQLAVPAIRAECEGLSGRAWRSLAAQIRQEGRRQQASTAFDALYGQEKDDDEQESEDEDSSEETSSDDSEAGEEVKASLSVTESQKSEAEVSSHSRKREHRLYQARERLTVNGVADDLSTETDVSPEGINASERKAAGCFKRQVALLRGLDRSSSPVPSLEPELDFSIRDDGLSSSPAPPTKSSQSKRSKRVQSIEEHAHISEAQALMDLGKTALSLGEVDSAVMVFKRRLRMTESRYSRSSTTCGDVNRGHSSVLGAGSRPSTSPHPGKCRAPTRRADSSESHSRGTLGLFDPRTAPRATRFAHPEEDSSRRAFANATHMEKEETPSLDVAEALWWFVVSISHQNLGVDLTSNPRFLPFNVPPRRPSACGCGKPSMSQGNAKTSGGRSVQRKFATLENVVAVAPVRPEPPRDNDEEKPTHVRPRTRSICGEDCAGYPGDSGERHFVSLAPLAHRRIRPSSCKVPASPWAYHKDGMYKLPGRARMFNTRSDGSRLGSRVVRDDGEADLLTSPCQGAELIGSCFAAVQENERLGGATWEEQSFASGAVVPASTGWPTEEAPGKVIKNGPLWRDSGFGRITELILDGVPQGIADASQPAVESLQRQLSIALASDSAGEMSPLNSQPSRKQTVTRDALMGLGTMAILRGDDCGGCVLYERAAECCRSLGDWTGMANALAAKARLHMATGCFAEAGRGFELVLKLAYELNDGILAASAHSFQGWVMASQRDVGQALNHFRQCRKLSFRNQDDSAAAASELAIAHMHVRLATTSQRSDGHHNVSRNPPQTGIIPALEIASHMELVAARRHYLRYLRWTQARDASGVSHAHMCLARMYQAMEDEESFEHHKQASLQGCHWPRDTDDQFWKMRALEHEGVVRGMLELN